MMRLGHMGKVGQLALRKRIYLETSAMIEPLERINMEGVSARPAIINPLCENAL